MFELKPLPDTIQYAAIGYALDDLKGISPTLCQHKINLEKDAKPVIDHQ